MDVPVLDKILNMPLLLPRTWVKSCLQYSADSAVKTRKPDAVHFNIIVEVRERTKTRVLDM